MAARSVTKGGQGPALPRPAARDLHSLLAGFADAWTPKVVGQVNGNLLKLVHTQGDFVWHQHDHSDECFLVLSGHLDIHFADHVVSLDPGQLCVVPKGVQHKPVGTASVLLFESADTHSTGGAADPRAVDPADLHQI